MKYIKLFENKDLPQIEHLDIGEYVIVEPDADRIGLSKDWRDFLKCNIGKIIDNHKNYYYPYIVEFKLTRKGGFLPLGTETLRFRLEEIVDHSKKRNDLEYIEDAKKYNV